MADLEQNVVAFLTLSSDSAVDEFVNVIGEKLPEHDIKCVRLANDVLESFHMLCSEEYNAVVLLHSVHEGRNAVTDVPDAKYDELLPELKGKYGAGRVAVVIFSMHSLQQSFNKDLMMLDFIREQPTTFDCSKCVIQCNNLLTMDMAYQHKLISFLTEKLGQIKDEEYYDNAVALLNHSGPDNYDTSKLSGDLKTQFPFTAFRSLNEESVKSIHHYKAVLVLVDKTDFENESGFSDQITGYSAKIEPKGHLGLLIMKNTDESVSIKDGYQWPRIQLFEYRRVRKEYIFEKTTLNDMKEWCTKDCRLQENASCWNKC